MTRLSTVPNNEMCDLPDSEILSPIDVATAQKEFSLCFAKRYSNLGPSFYFGPLDEAVASMFDSNGRPLVLYIHNDDSIAAHIFCEQVLCATKIIDCLDNYFVVWPWDRTRANNYEAFLAMLKKSVGQAVVNTVTALETDRYPILLSLIPNKRQVELVEVIYGSTSNDDTLKRLIQARDFFDSRLMSPLLLEHSRFPYP